MIPPSSVELTRVHYYDENKTHRNLEISTISREVYQNTLNKNIVIKRNIFGHKWVLKINENSEDKNKDKCNPKVVVYVWVFCCIVVAIAFGIYLSIENKLLQRQNNSNKILVPNMIVNESNNNEISLMEDDILLKYDVALETITLGVEVHGNDDNGQHVMTTERSIDELTTKITTKTFHNVSHILVSNDTMSLLNICQNCIDDEEICLKTEEFHSPLCVKILDRRDPTGCGGLCELNVQHCRRLHPEIEVFQCIKNQNILHCPADSFNCGNRCIEKNKRCDGVIHCTNMVDELDCECNMEAYFHCGNRTSCIEKFKKCNGVIDCWDSTDELDCYRDCQTDELSCLSGDCIKKSQFCDGTVDCKDKSDEPEGC